MRHDTLMVFLFAMLTTSTAAAQPRWPWTPEAPKNTNVTANPVGVLAGAFNVQLSRAYGRRVSAEVVGEIVTNTVIDELRRNVSAGLGVTRFANEFADNGWFVGTLLYYTHTFDQDTAAGRFVGIDTLAPGVYGGYRWVWESGFNVNLGFGSFYALALEDVQCPEDATCTREGHDGIVARGHFQVGFMF